jgi:hypothetical protein
MSKRKKKKKKAPKGALLFLKRKGVDPRLEPMLKLQGSYDIEEWFTECGLAILVSTEPTPHGDLRHVSVSRIDRYPSWEEIKKVREKFLPMDKPAMMVFPTKDYYVNLHQNCFHVWESPIEWNIA